MHFLNKKEMLEFVKERAHLFDEAGQQNPFSCSAWVLHFLENIAESDWMFFVPESVVAGHSLMLLYSKNDSPYKRMSLTNYYASLYSPLIGPEGNQATAVRHLISQLVERRPRCATINFAPLVQSSAVTRTLKEAFLENGWYTKQYFCFGNWYLPCQGLSFDDFMANRPSEVYNTWLRKSKKFHKQKNMRLEIIKSAADLPRAIDAYNKVYLKSWKKPEPYPDFVPGWARICAENGWLRLGIAWMGEVPIAVQFWFTMNDRAYIFKLAYDEEFSAWSAGTILTAYMIKSSLEEDGAIEIDYLTGDDNYKRSWMSHRRERIGLLACNLRSARGVVTAAGEFAKETTVGELVKVVAKRMRRPALPR